VQDFFLFVKVEDGDGASPEANTQEKHIFMAVPLPPLAHIKPESDK
jgi:hypothetical protein